jgi:hypothetical protein
MEIFLNALRALWAVFKAQGASKAASELPQGAAQVKAVSDDLAEISAELVRGPVEPPPVPAPPVPKPQPAPAAPK